MMHSRIESFGVSAVEASFSGLGVIASRFGGIPEIVIHGETGLLVDPEDAQGFGKAIASLAEDKNLRLEMGIKCRNSVKAKYDWKNCVNQMIEIYNQVNTHGQNRNT